MDRHRTVALTLALGLALVAGSAAAGPGTEYAGQEIGTIRYVNRAQNLVVLNSGKELYATDQRMISGLREGELVKVDFYYNGERATLNSIEPATTDDSPGASPTTEGGVHEH